jgi:hypothetical protein
MKSLFALFTITLSMALSLCGAVPSFSFLGTSGFPSGEALKYNLSWSGIKVGRAYLSITGTENLDGVPCHVLELRVESSGIADAIYPVNNRFRSYVSIADRRVHRYRVEQHEGKTHRDATISFDWEALTVTYQRDGEAPKAPVPILEGTCDPLSVVYLFREKLDATLDLVEVPVSDGKKALMVQIKQQGKSPFSTPVGPFEALKVQPDTRDLAGVFKKSKNASIHMWFSTDEQRLPLRIKSKVVVGSFSADLESIHMPEPQQEPVDAPPSPIPSP